MPDLKDELDALFEDDGEPKAEEAAEETTEEQAEEAADGEKTDAKPKSGLAKKSKLVGARTGAINVARKLPGKPAVGTKPAAKPAEPAPEAEFEEEPAHAHVSHAKVAAAPASSGGAGVGTPILACALLLNLVVLIIVGLLMAKVGKLEKQLTEVANETRMASNMSRAKLSLYTDRGGIQNAVLVIMPKDVTEYPKGTKVYVLPLDKLTRSEGQ